MNEPTGGNYTATPNLEPRKPKLQIAIGLVILLVGISTIGYLFYKDKPVEEPVINLSSELTDEFEFNQDQYKAIINGVFASNEDGTVIVKADFIFEKLLLLEERVAELETKLQTNAGEELSN